MKKGMILALALFAMVACNNNDNTQNVADNESPVTRADKVEANGNALDTIATSEALGEMSMQYLDSHLGETPSQNNLLETEPLNTRLKVILGDRLNEFKEVMKQGDPLKKDQVYYTMSTSGNKSAFLIVDPKTNVIQATMIGPNGREDFPANNGRAALHVPTSVNERMSKGTGKR
ncbi:hypothetical protein [Telluribacter sp. SYSU D00476]|uniref:hypothetical protein n=1 Tax=Telluribacter sp. SYSU D00476 TaxID=2811430 RepID=UPI001FF4406A|nr:hypothetical protein [Telluribacter sp. SYSU D00476]